MNNNSIPKYPIWSLTTSAETLTGSAGNDAFNAVVQAAGATGTTILPGDILNGGEGTDTLTISTAGNPAGAYTVAAIQSTGIEKILLNAFDTDATADGTVVDLTLMSGVTTVGLSSSNATGDVKFDNVNAIVDITASNGSGDLTVAYNAAVTAGSSDTQKIALVNQSAGTLTVAGVENVQIATSLAKSTLTELAATSMSSLTVSGDQNLTITNALDFADSTSSAASAIDGTIDASNLSGKLKVAPNAADNVNITGGSGADTFVMAAGLNGFDVIDGGDGNDTITMNAATISTQFAQVSNIEVVQFNSSAAAIGIDASKVGADVIVVDLTDANDGDSAKLASTVTSANGKTITIAKTVEDAADADDSDGTKLTITDTTDSADDTVNIVLANIGRDSHADTDYFGIDEIDVGNYETVNITANANATGTNKFNEVEALTAGSATSIVVTGTGSLETVLTGTKVTSFDASALAGSLTLTAGTEKATYKLGASDSTLAMGANLNASDTIVGGAGTKDTVTASVSGLTATTGALKVSAVETIALTTGGANVLNLAAVTGVSTLAVTDNKQTITAFDLVNTTIQLGLAADESATASEVDITAADATGSDDTLKVYVENSNGATTSTIDISNVENLAVTVDDTNNVTLDLTTAEVTAITLAEKTGVTGGTLALGTLHKNTNSITSSYDGAVTVSFANQVAPNGSAITYTGNGTAVQTVTGGDLSDTITIGSTGAITHVITGGAGTDTVNLSVKAGFVNAGSINVENLNVSVKAGDDVDISGGATFNSGVDNVVLTGGNSLSTFTTGTIHTNLKSVDASGFSGNVAMTLAADAADSTVTLKAGSLLTDTLAYQITAAGTDALQTEGIDTIVLNADETATLDMSNSDATMVAIDVAASKTITIDKADGTLIRVTDAPASATVEAKVADSTGAADSISFEIKGGTLGTSYDLKTTDIETVNIKSSTASTADLSNLAMATAGKTMGLTVTGTAALTISALNADVTSIDASGMTAGGVVQTARSSTSKATYTGSDGADTFIMNNLTDVITGGAGTDTLDINYSAILGGINVDLSSSTNQIASANGSAISGTVTGFENVDLSGYTGTFGALITSGSSALAGTTSKITGTANIDQITLGSGADTVVIGLTSSDTIGGFSVTNDKIQLASATFVNGDFGTGAAINAGANEDVVVATTALADDAAIVTAIRTATDTTDTLFVVFNTADSEAQVWYDADPNTDGGETQVATLVGVTDLSGFAAGNFTFV